MLIHHHQSAASTQNYGDSSQTMAAKQCATSSKMLLDRVILVHVFIPPVHGGVHRLC